jgi:hypothetical protein
MKSISLTPIRFIDSTKEASQQLSGSIGATGSLYDALAIAKHARSLLEKQHHSNEFAEYYTSQPQPETTVNQSQQPAVTLPNLNANTSTLDLQKVDKVDESVVTHTEQTSQSVFVQPVQPIESGQSGQPVQPTQSTQFVQHAANPQQENHSQRYTIVSPDGEVIATISDLRELSQYSVSKIEGTTITAEKLDVNYYREHLQEGLEFAFNHSKASVQSYLPFAIDKLIGADQNDVNSRVSAYVSSLVIIEITRLFRAMHYDKSLYSAPSEITKQLQASATRFSYNQQIEGEHALLQPPLSDYKVSYVELSLPPLRDNAKVHHLAHLVLQKLLESLTASELSDLLDESLEHIVTSIRLVPKKDRGRKVFIAQTCVFFLRK